MRSGLRDTLPEKEMISDELMEVLACPQCKGRLEKRTSPEALVCKKCALAFPVRDDIPVMLVDEAEKLTAEKSGE